jgi:hypothetical protein
MERHLMSMLKDAEGDRPADEIAPGSNGEGKVVVMTPEEAAKSLGERDADEEAFAHLIPGGKEALEEENAEDFEDFSDQDDDDEDVLAAIEGAR